MEAERIALNDDLDIRGIDHGDTFDIILVYRNERNVAVLSSSMLTDADFDRDVERFVPAHLFDAVRDWVATRRARASTTRP